MIIHGIRLVNFPIVKPMIKGKGEKRKTYVELSSKDRLRKKEPTVTSQQVGTTGNISSMMTSCLPFQRECERLVWLGFHCYRCFFITVRLIASLSQSVTIRIVASRQAG